MIAWNNDWYSPTCTLYVKEQRMSRPSMSKSVIWFILSSKSIRKKFIIKKSSKFLWFRFLIECEKKSYDAKCD